MNTRHNPVLTGNAQSLRKNMTKEERHLWYDFLKSYSVSFRRQKVIGAYIVDFYCAQAKIIVDLDGSQHYEAEGKKADANRDEYLSEQGYLVLRYSNAQVNTQFQAVCADIDKHVSKRIESKMPVHSKSLPLEGKVDRRSRDG